MYQIARTSQFKKDYKIIQKRNWDINELKTVIQLLANGEELPQKYRDHALIGDKKDSRECHVKPDFLLQYRIDADVLILTLIRTGSHSDIF